MKKQTNLHLDGLVVSKCTAQLFFRVAYCFKKAPWLFLYSVYFMCVKFVFFLSVRNPEGKLSLYCKGADTIIYERLHPSCSELMKVTTEHLNVSQHQRALETLQREHLFISLRASHANSHTLDNIALFQNLVSSLSVFCLHRQ